MERRWLRALGARPGSAETVVTAGRIFLRGIFLVGEDSLSFPPFVHQKFGACDSGSRHIMTLNRFRICEPIVRMHQPQVQTRRPDIVP